MEKPPKKTRKSNKIAMVYVSLRIPPEVDDFYALQGDNKSDAMRKVLIDYANLHTLKE